MNAMISARDLLALAGDHLWQSTLFAAAATLLVVALRRHSAYHRNRVGLAASAKLQVPISARVAHGGNHDGRRLGRERR